jgi:hypothetical protein
MAMNARKLEFSLSLSNDYLEDEEECDNNKEVVYEANPEDVAGKSLVAQRLCIAPPTKKIRRGMTSSKPSALSMGRSAT